VKPHAFKVGDKIKVVKVPSGLHDAAGIGTPELFQRLLGKILRIEAFDEYGHLDLNVFDDGSQTPDYCHHTIWIEPEFVEAAPDATPTQPLAAVLSRSNFMREFLMFATLAAASGASAWSR
jgi:hypothetical protein